MGASVSNAARVRVVPRVFFRAFAYAGPDWRASFSKNQPDICNIVSGASRRNAAPLGANRIMPSDANDPGFSRIVVRGARTHNLKSIDVDIPYYRITSFCGRSGSGKSTLALDVLYAEGNRRYVESLSPFVRQRLELLEKPEADRIENVPASIAVGAKICDSSSATVGNVTETDDYLRLLFAQAGVPYCQCCGKRIRRYSPETTVKAIERLPEGTRVMVAFAPSLESVNAGYEQFRQEWLEKGFSRCVVQNSVYDLRDAESLRSEFPYIALVYRAIEDFSEEDVFDDWGLRSSDAPKSEEGASDADDEDDEARVKTKSRVLMLNLDGDDSSLMRYLKRCDAIKRNPGAPPVFFIVDRVKAGQVDKERLTESVETAFAYGGSRCWVFAEGTCEFEDFDCEHGESARKVQGAARLVDGKEQTLFGFSRRLRCEECGVDFPDIEPNLFNYSSPKGACPICLGLGKWSAFDLNKVFPNHNLSISEGAVAPWNAPAYRSKFKEFLTFAEKLDVRVNAPFFQLSRAEIDAVLNGSPKLGYKGLNGFLASLLAQKYKMHIRAYLNRWLVQQVCPVCKGARLRKEALAVRVEGKNARDLSEATISDLVETIDGWKLDPNRLARCQAALKQVRSRLACLKKVGLGYLSLSRSVSTLSSGESRRVRLTAALGSDLVNMLYVLDEPSNGLHPQDVGNLRDAIYDLRDRGNTVIVVDHNEKILEASDRIVELGPGAGAKGGEIVFEGTVEELKQDADSLTGSYLSGRRMGGGVPKRRTPSGFITLSGATGHNLKDVKVDIPLGCLCAITGVSGAGKSSLALDTLVPALYSRLGGDKNVVASGLPYKRLDGTSQLDEAVFVDQKPIGRSPRSNPVTYLKIFDDIRTLFAETPDARARGYNAGYFSFNVDGGRCGVCKGEGYLRTEMFVSADLYQLCPECNGKRYQRSALDVVYRGKNIYETLNLTAREAFEHFRGESKIQQKLKKMLDVGLDYLRLGQPVNTLSGGEAQRLKLCSYLFGARQDRCMFVLDEPTAGLHFADVVKMLDVFNTLVDAGSSVVVIEHNPFVVRAADYIIDMGPGAADKGGEIVATGAPEQVAENEASVTGRYIAEALKMKRER